MQISTAGLKLIEQFEGFSGTPYLDSVGVPTIGYGHTHGVSMQSPPLTVEQATALLKADVDNEYGAAVNQLGLPLNQNQYDATTSFVYNLGPGVLSTSGTFGSYLHARLWVQAANSMLLYDHAGGQVLQGLLNRRELERALFLAPVKPLPDPLAVLTQAERQLVDRYNAENHHPHLHVLELKHLRAQIAQKRKEVYRAAVDGVLPSGASVQKGWDHQFRTQRYHILAGLVPPG